jgi:general secretion pathway protein D
LSGLPGLSQIPILKYLFGQTQTDHSENEIVFVMIPHIVRAPDISEANQQALDVGTASAIQLHRASHAVTITPTPAQAAPAQPNVPAGQPPAATPPPQNQVAPQGAALAQPPAGPGNGAKFSLDPAATTQKAGATFAVNVVLSGAQNAFSVPLQLNYDPKILQVVNVSKGDFLSQDGQAVAVVDRDDDSTGTLQVTASRPPGASGISGQGTVVTLTFMAKAAGQSVLTIGRGGVRDPGMQSIPVAGASASVTVQ